jgi:hypothetical protein
MTTSACHGLGEHQQPSAFGSAGVEDLVGQLLQRLAVELAVRGEGADQRYVHAGKVWAHASESA